jgi:mRNA interferase RelE/StbE
MLITQTINSKAARQNWRDLLDAAHKGVGDTVIERNGRPIAAVIPYADFLALQEELAKRLTRHGSVTPAWGAPGMRLKPKWSGMGYSMPETWHVIVLRDPEKLLAKLPKDLRQRLGKAIDGLETDPHPPGSERLTGFDLYRLRVGDWRIIYRLEDDRLIVLVVEIGPRGGAYKSLAR